MAYFYLVTLGNGSQKIYCSCKLPKNLKDSHGSIKMNVTTWQDSINMEYWNESLTDKHYRELEMSFPCVVCDECLEYLALRERKTGEKRRCNSKTK